MQKTKKVLVPRYFKDFKCIGSACEDTCCRGWHVLIDYSTYNRYRSCRDKTIKNDLNECIVRNRSNPDDVHYAYIKFNKAGECPLLDDNRLCRVHKSLGEKFLSDVCSFYPRICNIVDGRIEKSASISCPEVTRLALLNQEGIDFVEIEEDIRIKSPLNRILNNTSINEDNMQKYTSDIRTFTIQLLKARDYALWERLIVLGMFFNKLQSYCDNNKQKEIPNLIQEFEQNIVSGLYIGAFENLGNNDMFQMQVLKEISSARIFNGTAALRYIECYKEFLDGIEYNENKSLGELNENYRNAYNRYYKPFMDKHEYILENYLVNYVFSSVFPFAGEERVFDSYIMLVIRYALIKLHLIGIAGYYKSDFSIDIVIRLIQAFGKAVDHDNMFLKKVFDFMSDNNFVSIAHMSILIKND